MTVQLNNVTNTIPVKVKVILIVILIPSFPMLSFTTTKNIITKILFILLYITVTYQKDFFEVLSPVGDFGVEVQKDIIVNNNFQL